MAQFMSQDGQYLLLVAAGLFLLRCCFFLLLFLFLYVLFRLEFLPLFLLQQSVKEDNPFELTKITLKFFTLKVHKNEKFFSSSFEFCTYSLLATLKYYG